MTWTVGFASAAVGREIEDLPADMQIRLARLIDLIELEGLAALPPKAVKHLEDKLWELRISGRDGIARAIYLTSVGRRVVVLRVFVKKSQKTPDSELALARARAKLLG